MQPLFHCCCFWLLFFPPSSARFCSSVTPSASYLCSNHQISLHPSTSTHRVTAVVLTCPTTAHLLFFSWLHISRHIPLHHSSRQNTESIADCRQYRVDGCLSVCFILWKVFHYFFTGTVQLNPDVRMSPGALRNLTMWSFLLYQVLKNRFCCVKSDQS